MGTTSNLHADHRHIDAELRALAAYRSACAADGEPVRSTAVVDELLDERIIQRSVEESD